MYKEAKLQIESIDGIVEIDGWAATDERWNGWSYVLMNKENAMKLVEKLSDVLRYDEKTEEVVEVFDDNQHESDNDLLHWVKHFNEEISEEVYSIGSGYWCWTHNLKENL